MKFLHLGDLHLGKSVNEFSMIESQRFILEEIIKIAEEKQVTAVLVSGDIYDRPIPPEEAVKLLDWFITELTARDIRLLMISGNHDSDERLNFGSGLFQNSGVYIAGRYDGDVPVYTLSDEHGPVDFYLLPFVKASLVSHYFENSDCSTYDSAVRTALDAAIAKHANASAPRRVLLAHQFVVGGSHETELAGSETSAVNVGTLESIDASAFADFDYVALGHIHSAQRVGSDNVRYSGSPLKYSLSEIGHQKSVPLVELGAKADAGSTGSISVQTLAGSDSAKTLAGSDSAKSDTGSDGVKIGASVNIELIPLTPLHDMRHIKGPIKKLFECAEQERAINAGKGEASPMNDYLYITLTDETPVLDALEQLRLFYPNIMKLDYDNSHTRSMMKEEVTSGIGTRSFTELIHDFYTQLNGGEPTSEELDILYSAAREAGIEGVPETSGGDISVSSDGDGNKIEGEPDTAGGDISISSDSSGVNMEGGAE